MSTLKTHNLQSPDSGSVNIAMAPNAGMVVAGLSTYSNQINVGNNIKLGTAGIVTATSFVGSGANLTSLPSQITFNNASANRVLTSDGGTAVNAEANFTYNGTEVNITGTTDGVINLNTTDSRGSFIRYQQGGVTKVWAGCGQGLSLGDVDDFGIRATDNIRLRAGASERMTINGSDGVSKFQNFGGGQIHLGGASAHTAKITITDNAGSGNGNFLFGGPSSTHLKVASGGNILIGDGSTYSPGCHVHLHGGTTGLQQLRVQNHTSIGSFSGNYGSEFRHAFSSAQHCMLIHTEEAADARRTLDISDSNGIFGRFVNGKTGLGRDSSGNVSTRGVLEICAPFDDVSDNDGSADLGTNGHDALIINIAGPGAASGKNVGSIAWGGGRRRAAIMAEYQNTDSDYIALAFFTRGTDGAGDFYKSFIINHNGSASLHGSLSQNTSDDRLKKDKVEIENALDKVNSLSSFTHKWNEIAVRAGLEENKTEIGLSAQEVQGLYPSLVDVNNTMIDPDNPTTEYLTIHYEKVVPLLVASIKELTSEINSLKSRLSSLEGS